MSSILSKKITNFLFLSAYNFKVISNNKLKNSIGFSFCEAIRSCSFRVSSIEDLIAGLEAVPDIAAIKAARKEYTDDWNEPTPAKHAAQLAEYKKEGGNVCTFGLYRPYKCNTCDAEFVTTPRDARHCPACGGTKLKLNPGRCSD